MARAKSLTKADQQLWAAFTQNIFLLPGKTRLPVDPPAPTPPEPAAAPAQNSKRAQTSNVKPVHPATTPSGIDKSTWKNFSTGKRRPEKKLDLHGHTATRAHHATIAFIQHAYTEQIRCIEIVTGNGEVLARELPHWLNAPGLRPLILATVYAPTANTGAVRILLRRHPKTSDDRGHVFENNNRKTKVSPP